MNKRAIDIKAAIPDEGYMEDRGSLKHAMVSLNAPWFTANQKKINRTGMFERHAQYHQAWQIEALMNMYTNYIKAEKVQESQIRSRVDIEGLLKGMLEKYGCQWFWDPSYKDPLLDNKCDLLLSTRDQVIRLLWDLAFTACEKENDSQGLRTLCRISIAFFRNKSKAATSLYARYTCYHLLVYLTSSKRTQERLNHLVTVNPSGTRGGGMAR